MMIPNFENVRFVNRDGYLTDEWQNIFQSLISSLQTNVSNEGYRVPQQPTTTINMLQSQFASSPSPSVYYGNLLYDSTTNQLKVFLADNTFHVITTV
jgi:hypothetical protein